MSNTICPLPFTHQQIQPDGEIRFCCAARPNSNLDSQGQSCKIETHSLLESWNSESLRKLRLELINGDKPECCTYCWVRENEDNTQGVSMRLDSINRIPIDTIQDRITYAQTHSGELIDKPYDFQVMSGNLCNLACKMCTPQYSTAFSKYFKNHGIENLSEVTFNKQSTRLESYNEHFNQTYNWPVTHPLKETFNDYFDSIREVFILGGEPTLLDGTLEFLEYLKSHGLAKNVIVRLSTNCTNINPRLLSALDEFGYVGINISLDGMDEVAHIQRTPSHWPTIKDNLDKLMHWAKHPNKQRILSVHSVITSLNFHHITDFWYYIIIQYNQKGLSGISAMPIVENDDNFPLSIVPKDIAAEVRLELIKTKLKISQNYHFAFDKLLLQIDNTQFADNYDLIHYQLDQIQRFHPELDIKEIYSIYYKDSV